MDESYLPIKTVCDNGLTVMTMHVPGREGLIAGEISIHVGGAHAALVEPRLLGAPHYNEHMILFGASRNFGAREVMHRLSDEFALTHNASTSAIWTRFFRSGNAGHVVPANQFWDAFTMVADGTFFPKYDQETFLIEGKRILNEIKTMSTPERLDFLDALSRMNGMPYMKYLSVGTIEDVQFFKREDCADIHRNYYTLANASVVLVGDVRHDRDVKKIENILAQVPANGAKVPALESQNFQTGQFRKPSDFQENEGCVRVDILWPAFNYSSPDRTYAMRMAGRALSDLVGERLQSTYGLYNACVFCEGSLDTMPTCVMKVEGGDKNSVVHAIQDGLEQLTHPDTAALLAERHEKIIRRQEIVTRVEQLDLQTLARQVNDAHMIGAPLDIFGPHEINRIRNIAPASIGDVIGHLRDAPLFQFVRGHEGAIDSVPSVEQISAWRHKPNRSDRDWTKAAVGTSARQATPG